MCVYTAYTQSDILNTSFTHGHMPEPAWNCTFSKGMILYMYLLKQIALHDAQYKVG